MSSSSYHMASCFSSPILTSLDIRDINVFFYFCRATILFSTFSLSTSVSLLGNDICVNYYDDKNDADHDDHYYVDDNDDDEDLCNCVALAS